MLEVVCCLWVITYFCAGLLGVRMVKSIQGGRIELFDAMLSFLFWPLVVAYSIVAD